MQSPLSPASSPAPADHDVPELTPWIADDLRRAFLVPPATDGLVALLDRLVAATTAAPLAAR